MAWIATLVAAGVQAWQANQAKKDSKKIGDQQSRLYSVQADQLEKLGPYATDFYQRSKEAYDPAFSYYRAIAGNDRSKMTAAVAPELQATGEKYNAMIGASRALNARGGASAAYNTDLFYRSGDEAQSLINTQRTNAYGNLAKMAGIAGDLGSGASGNATNAGNGASGMLSAIAGQQALTNKQMAEAYAQIGKALTDSVGYNQNTGWYIGNNAGRG
jgi:hypothetical protein